MVSNTVNDHIGGDRGPRGAWVLRVGARIDRALTRGLEPREREAQLRERQADRADHLADPDATVASVAARTARSGASDLGYLLLGGEATAIPVAVMFAIIGVGAFWQTATAEFEPVVRTFDAVLGVGLVAVAAAGLRHPRSIYKPWLLPAVVIASIGTLGGALTIPIVAGTEVYDLANKAALGAVGVGFVVVAIALLPRTVNRTWLVRGGAVLWVAALGNAVAQLGWAVVNTGTETSRGASLMVAAGCVVGAALLGRLRNIPITGRGEQAMPSVITELGEVRS